MNSIGEDRNEILTVHRNWWRANERWDIPLMKTCFPVGPNYLMFNYNWHPYFGIDEKVRLWEYYKDSGMTMEPPDVRILKFEVIGDIAYIANEFEIRTNMPAQENALIDEVQALRDLDRRRGKLHDLRAWRFPAAERGTELPGRIVHGRSGARPPGRHSRHDRRRRVHRR